MSKQELLAYIRASVHVYGSQKQAACVWQISEAYLSDVLAGRREPAGKLLTALGIRREVIYQRTVPEG